MCANLDKADLFASMGFDYLEITVGSFSDLAEADFEALVAKAQRSPIPCEAMNCFFPGSIRLTGQGVDMARIAAHAENVMARAARLGVKIAVVGSGGARKVPEGFDPLRARRQFAEALSIVGDAGLRHGVHTVIEPLNRGETNLVNRFQDGAALAAELHHPGVSTLIDYFHMAVEGEAPSVILDFPGTLRHVHIANPTGRVFPREAGESAYGAFFSILKEARYEDRMSIEGKSDQPAVDSPVALALLRALAHEASLRNLATA
jgi:sugar phosphate isomerase/epimerase